MARLYELYKNEITPKMMEKFQYKTLCKSRRLKG